MEKKDDKSDSTKTTLISEALAKGIERKATDEELTEYLKKGINAEHVLLEFASSKYNNSKAKNSHNH